MAFDYEAWKRALRKGTAPRYQYKGITGAHDRFANALTSHDPFLTHFVRGVVEDLMDAFKQGDKGLREAWIKHCRETAEHQAAQYDERNYHEMHNDGGGHHRYEMIMEEMPNDRAQLQEWLRVRVVEDVQSLKDEVERKVQENDEDARAWREWHPPEGVYSRRRDYCYPFSALVGFCPRCHEPLPQDAISQDRSRGGAWSLKCPECRLDGSIDWNVKQFGHRADVLPFTDVTLKSMIEQSKAYRSATYAVV